jgi:hypothetical protein
MIKRTYQKIIKRLFDKFKEVTIEQDGERVLWERQDFI